MGGFTKEKKIRKLHIQRHALTSVCTCLGERERQPDILDISSNERQQKEDAQTDRPTWMKNMLSADLQPPSLRPAVTHLAELSLYGLFYDDISIAPRGSPDIPDSEPPLHVHTQTPMRTHTPSSHFSMYRCRQ